MHKTSSPGSQNGWSVIKTFFSPKFSSLPRFISNFFSLLFPPKLYFLALSAFFPSWSILLTGVRQFN